MALTAGPSVTDPWQLAAFGADALLTSWQTLGGTDAEATIQALEGLRSGAEPEGGDATPPALPTMVERYPPSDHGWPECTPQVGNWAFQIHRVPDAEPHWPIPGDHVHFFLRQQNPESGHCFWKRNARPSHFLNQGEGFEPELDMIPL